MGAAMSQPYFSQENKRDLKRIFMGIADFIHEHGLQQVVSAGPSAAPFSKAIQRAYANRHGGKLSIVNLGEAGEKFRRLNTAEEVLAHLRRHKPYFDTSRRTLLFDEFALSGVSLSMTSSGFAQIGVPHKTAVLVNGSNTNFDYVGCKEDGPFGQLGEKVDFFLSRKLKKRGTPAFRSFIATLKQELAEIADSVPRKKYGGKY